MNMERRKIKILRWRDTNELFESIDELVSRELKEMMEKNSSIICPGGNAAEIAKTQEQFHGRGQLRRTVNTQGWDDPNE